MTVSDADALVAWKRLGLKKQLEVAKHARHHEAHPEAEVAAVATAWAAAILRREEKRSGIDSAVIGLAGVAFSDVLVSDVRLARKIQDADQ